MQHETGQPFTTEQRAVIRAFLHKMPAAGRLDGAFRHDHDLLAETLELSARFGPRGLSDFVVAREGDAIRVDMLRGAFPSVLYPDLGDALASIMATVQQGLPRRHPMAA